MAYKKIEEIIVNGNSGEIFDSYIYGSNLELGFSESPTKLTLNIVKENGDFSSFPNSLTTSYYIEIGDLILSKMYLYSYEISRSVGQKVATLNFFDNSFILDKIFIGLINRHGSAGYGPNIPFELTAACVKCDGLESESRTSNIYRSIYSGLEVNVDLNRGGSIILGQEQFMEGACDIPDVAYNFTLLLKAMSQAGINVLGLVDINPLYYQTYVGTLREVLSNWCADFGYTFYWDFQTNTIRGIDLKLEVDYISEIKSIISANSSLNINTTNSNTLAIESFNESQSLEGTVTQKHISRYLKPSKVKNSNTSAKNVRTFTCIKPEKIKVNSESIIRAVLGKYNDNARTVYCAKNMQTKGKYIGYSNLINVITISPQQKNNNIFTQAFAYGYNNPAITNMINKYNGAQILIAVYDPSQKEKYTNWESSVANMIGKYYESQSEPASSKQECGETFFYQKNISVSPASTVYTNANKYDLPFADAIIGPEGVGGLEWSIPASYIFERSSTYGTSIEDYNAKMLNGDGSDPLEKYIPQILPIEGLAYTRLVGARNEAQKNNDTQLAQQLTNIIAQIDSLKAAGESGEKKVVFVFLPPSSIMNQGLIVTLGSDTNKLELAKNEDDPQKEAECTTKCETDLVQDICGKCADAQEPYVGLTTPPTCRKLTLSTDGKSIDIFMPSEANYTGFESIDNSLKFTVPGQKIVLGSIDGIDENTLSLQVAESDISNDLSPVDGSTIINMFVPDGVTPNTFKKVTPAEYHADLTKKITNSITVPRKSLSLSIIGLNLSTLGQYITPEKGLTSLSINLNENGATTQLSFANRPKILPKREAISQKIQPTIKLNTYRPK